MIKIERVLSKGSFERMSDSLEERDQSAKVIEAYEPGLLGFIDAPDSDDDRHCIAVYDQHVVISAVATQTQQHSLEQGEPMSDEDAYERAMDEVSHDQSYFCGPVDPIFLSCSGSRSMTMEDYQDNAIRTAQGMESPMMLANWGLGLAGEAGEVIELIKKSLYHGKDLDKSALSKELGDVLWYIAAICEQTGISLDDVAEQNVAKLANRYPNGFVKGGGER